MSRYRPVRNFIFAAAVGMLLVLPATSVSAQYFGRNKVQYEDFDFKILKTEHIDVYYYPSARQAAIDAGRMVERWYSRYAELFGRELDGRQPLILYANHPDFQQTNVIGGLIGQGTGGVTEGLRRRIVLPLTGIYQENDHVIGHELVHAFHYNIAKTESKGRLRGLNAPLWFIEGMSEYLSLGPDYPATAMWLRDAVIHDRVPTLDDMTNSREYFPYRWGHAFWTYVTGRWGDQVIPQLYIGLQRGNYDKVFKAVLGMEPDSLSVLWRQSIIDTYGPAVAGRIHPDSLGSDPLPNEDDDSPMNLSPTISPDGRWAAFISQRDLFSLDLYLADLEAGKVERKIVSSGTNAHFDALQFTNSSGTWSPDSKQMAIPVVDDGDSKIAVVEVSSGDVKRTIFPSEIETVQQVAWSPDGDRLLFTGTSGGISNLYLYDFNAENAVPLTNDRYAQLQPAWSPDGESVAYATDRTTETDMDVLEFGPMRIAVMDLETRSFVLIPRQAEGKQINPQYSPDGSSLYFVGDKDGFSDVFEFSFADSSITPVTHVATGISGLTSLSPALSVARDDGTMLYTVFSRGGYRMRIMAPEASAPEVRTSVASYLSDLASDQRPTAIQSMLAEPDAGLHSAATFDTTDYDPSLSLVYAGQTQVGVAIDRFGASLGGGASFLFADMLNNRMLGIIAQVNGGLDDIGGQVTYRNQDSRWNWGASVGHIPYEAARIRTDIDTVDGRQAFQQEIIRQQVFAERVSLLTEYPLNENQRFEFSTGYSFIHYDVDVDVATYVDGFLVDVSQEDRDAPASIHQAHGSVAFVGDYSFFGFTSPISGSRYRLEVEPTAGTIQYLTILADYRKYFFANPLTLAVRGLHYGRYFGDAESDRLSQLFVGYESYVRGYPVSEIDASECSGGSGKCPEFDRLIGSKMGVFNAELRVPLFGTSEYGLVNASFLPIELVGFFDAGVAWTENTEPELKWETRSAERIPVFSAGGAARVNLLGYLVMQFYYAFPFQRPETTGQFGFLIAPGW